MIYIYIYIDSGLSNIDVINRYLLADYEYLMELYVYARQRTKSVACVALILNHPNFKPNFRYTKDARRYYIIYKNRIIYKK